MIYYSNAHNSCAIGGNTLDVRKFEQLMISEPVLRALNDMGFEEPTPIQQEAIPVAMSGKDYDRSSSNRYW